MSTESLSKAKFLRQNKSAARFGWRFTCFKSWSRGAEGQLNSYTLHPVPYTLIYCLFQFMISPRVVVELDTGAL